MTTRTQTLRTSHTPLLLRAIAPWRLGRLLALFRQRRDLAALDDRMLRDLGLTRAEAEREAMRPIWDVPHTWRQ